MKKINKTLFFCSEELSFIKEEVKEHIKTAIEVGNLGLTDGFLCEEGIVFFIGFHKKPDGSLTPWAIVLDANEEEFKFKDELDKYVNESLMENWSEELVAGIASKLPEVVEGHFPFSISVLQWSLNPLTNTFDSPQ